MGKDGLQELYVKLERLNKKYIDKTTIVSDMPMKNIFQEKRVYGYISELLMDVWLETNGFKYIEIPWGQIGGKNDVKKLFHINGF